MLEVLCRAWWESLIICLPCHAMLSCALKCFFLNNVDQVKPPPSFDSWFDPLHMWWAIRPLGDAPPPVCPWWGEDYIPWCCLGCFCIHCEECRVSRLVGANPRSSTTSFSIFSSTNQHCFIGGWDSRIDWCHHCRPHSRILGTTSNSFLWVVVAMVA
jgi:hypothetical protein